jgi:hypothetical protein
MDLNIDHYSVDELIDILELQVVDRNTIIKSTEHQMEKYSTKSDVVQFYKDAQKKLLDTLPSENVGRTFITEVKRGTINPDIKNIMTRIINIDSSIRLLTNVERYSTDSFVCELSDPILNVISISLLSLEIPISWYNFSKDKGTTTFMISSNRDTYPITISDGNYTLQSLLIAVKNAVNVYFSTFAYTYDDISGKVTFTMDQDFTIIWYDKFNNFKELANATYNNNLGRFLGFILPISLANQETTLYSMTAQGLVDVSGTKYIMLALNDFLQNRLNTNIIGLNTLPKIKSKMPSYYNLDIPQYRSGSSSVAVIPKSFIPQSKINTINAINEVTILPKISFCESSNMFAKISVKRTDWAKNSTSGSYQTVQDCGPVKLMVDNSGPLQINVREYFGPVTLSMLEFSLYDDKGNILGLNHADWSCSLLVKCIYQY